MPHNKFHIEVGEIGQNGVTKKGTNPPYQKTLKISELTPQTTINTPSIPQTNTYDGMVILPKTEFKGKLQIKNKNGELVLIDKQDAENMEYAGYAGIALFVATSATGGTGKFAGAATNTILLSRATFAAAQSRLQGDSWGAAFLNAGLNTVFKPSFTSYHAGISGTAEHVLENTSAKLLTKAANSNGVKKQLLNTSGQAIEAWVQIGRGFHKYGKNINKKLGLHTEVSLGKTTLSFTPGNLNLAYIAEKKALKSIPYIPQKVNGIFLEQNDYDARYHGKEMDALNAQINIQRTYAADGEPPGHEVTINRIKITQLESSGLAGQAATSPILTRIEPARIDNTLNKPRMMTVVKREPTLRELFDEFEKNVKPKNIWVERWERIIMPEKYATYDKIKKEIEEGKRSWGQKFGKGVSDILIGDLYNSIGQIFTGREYQQILSTMDENDVRRKKIAAFAVELKKAGGELKLNGTKIEIVLPPKPKVGVVTAQSLATAYANSPDGIAREEFKKLRGRYPTFSELETFKKQRSLIFPQNNTKLEDAKSAKEFEEKLKWQSIQIAAEKNAQNEKELEFTIRKWAIDTYQLQKVNAGIYMFNSDAIATATKRFKNFAELKGYYFANVNNPYASINYQGPTISQGRGTNR